MFISIISQVVAESLGINYNTFIQGDALFKAVRTDCLYQHKKLVLKNTPFQHVSLLRGALL